MCVCVCARMQKREERGGEGGESMELASICLYVRRKMCVKAYAR